MKFKTIIVVFNITILFFLGFVFFLPFIVLGKDMALHFWQSSWYFAPVLALVLVCIDVYFALNVRVFILLEKEDWPALVQELENQVIRKSRYSSRQVRLLLNAYLVLSDAQAVTALEKKLAVARPGLISANALIFGAARILVKDNAGAVNFFSARVGKGGAGGEWLRWYYGFSLLMAREFDEAADQLSIIAGESKDGILTGLSAFFLGENLKKALPARAAEMAEAAREGIERVRRVLGNRSAWDKEVKRAVAEVYAAVLAVYMAKAGDFIYR